MKPLILALTLAVMQAVPPIPPQAADNGAYGANKVSGQGNNKKQPSPDSLSSAAKLGNTGEKPTPQTDHHQNTEQSIFISAATAVPEKSWWDKLYVIFTGLLVIAGLAGIWYAYRTLKILYKQTYAIRRQAVLMRRSTRATEKSVKMQQIAQQQWIQLEGWRIEGRSPSSRATPSKFAIAMELINPTSMPLTVTRAEATVSGRPFDFAASNLLAPSDCIKVDFPIDLRPDEMALYEKYQLTLLISGSISYTDAFEESRTQPFCLTCSCGPGNYTQFMALQRNGKEEKEQP